MTMKEMMLSRLLRLRRNLCDATNEYYDDVVGHCALCSDVCLPERGTMNDCVLHCQHFYHKNFNPTFQRLSLESTTTFPLNDKMMKNDEGGFDTIKVIIVVAVIIIIILIAFIVVLIIIFCRRSKSNEMMDCQATGKLLSTASEASGSSSTSTSSSSNTRTSEKQMEVNGILIADEERMEKHRTGSDSLHHVTSEEADSSLCTRDIARVEKRSMMFQDHI